MSSREEYTAGLRALADLLDANPELHLPWTGTAGTAVQVCVANEDDPQRALAAWAASLPGHKRKDADETFFNLRGQVGAVHVEVFAYRSQVCRRVVTGTQEVTKTIPAPDAPMVEVTETVETVEWVCEPLLAEVTT